MNKDIVILSQMYLPQFDNEEKQALTNAIHALQYKETILFPCGIGDSVYEIFRGKIQEYEIISIHITKHNRMYGWKIKSEDGIYSNINGFCESVLFEKVFLTKEEAEEKLKRIKSK